MAQKVSLKQYKRIEEAENISNQHLFTDSSRVSSFFIQIKKSVKAHKHETHSEHVFVIEGEGNMELGNTTFTIKAGDLIFIPANTFHSVKTTSKKPLKVVSVQAPFFDGKDRILKYSDSEQIKQH